VIIFDFCFDFYYQIELKISADMSNPIDDASPEEGEWIEVHSLTKLHKMKKPDRVNYNQHNRTDSNNTTYGQVSTNIQDWKQITFRRPPKPVKELKQRTQIATSQQRHTAKIDREIDADNPSVLKKVTPQMSKRMIEYRSAKKMTQSQLGMATNLPVVTINSYENGSAIHEIETTQKINNYMAKNPITK